jgi:hypothetical protein
MDMSFLEKYFLPLPAQWGDNWEELLLGYGIGQNAVEIYKWNIHGVRFSTSKDSIGSEAN